MDLPAAWQPVVLAVCAVAASCCLHFLKFHELALGGLLLAVVAGARYPWLAVKTEVWAGVVVWLALAYLAFWVSREKRIEVSAETSAMRFVLRDLLSVGAVVSLGFWLHRVFEVPATWLWMGGITATILLGLGMSMRLPMLAIGAQGFHLVAFYFFPKYLEQESALLMIAPIVFVLASIVVSRQFEDAVPAEDPIDTMWRNFLAGAMFLFRVAAVILFSAWVGHFVDAAWQSPLIGAVALVMGVSAILGGNRSRFVFALIVFALALLQWTRDLFDAPPYDWPNALVCLVPVVLAELIRRTEGKSRPGSTFLGEESGAARVVLVSLAVIMAWRTASVFAGETFGGFYLTISWALLAFVVFGMGFGLQEKTYRWLGLLVLGFAVARILLIDVWRLEPLPRILSFVAIGMVLVTLGFVYNRYQEFIRRYL